MLITPLYREENGILTAQFRKGYTVIATDTDHDLTRGNSYIIESIEHGDIGVVNDKGVLEIYSAEWFSLSPTVYAFEELSDWIMVDHCATRIKKHGNADNIEDRVAFIEKTPRVRIGKNKFSLEENTSSSSCQPSKTDAWLSGPKGSSDYGKDEDSRAWCDAALQVLGWE